MGDFDKFYDRIYLELSEYRAMKAKNGEQTFATLREDLEKIIPKRLLEDALKIVREVELDDGKLDAHNNDWKPS